MILTRTPLRISLFGGGTDQPEFFTRSTGAVVSFTINKCIHVGVNEKFDGRTRVSYSKTEDVDEPQKLEHDIARETLMNFKLKGLEITSVSDIPGEGSGLGSSSAFTVGLLKALHAHLDVHKDAHPSVLAQTAYGIERNLCGHPVGKQDHYAAAFGGLNYFQFNQDGTVNAEKIPLTEKIREFLEQNVMLFWTGKTRKASGILADQANRFTDEKTTDVGKMLAKFAKQIRVRLEDEKFDGIGGLLDASWWLKKDLAPGVSTREIDLIYMAARQAGAQGGKLCGAGGGGFLILIVSPWKWKAVERAIGLRRVSFKVEESGSRVVYRG